MSLTIPLRWQGILVVASLAAPCCLWATGVTGSLIDSRSILIFVAVFLGSVVVGAAGFGSAAVAGALMLFWLVPISAVPILNSASFTTQIISVSHLWRSLQWRGCFLLIVGGLLGIPLGVLLLQWSDPDLFRFAFCLQRSERTPDWPRGLRPALVQRWPTKERLRSCDSFIASELAAAALLLSVS